MSMVDISSNIQKFTLSSYNYSTTYLRSVLNKIGSYRGTTYYYIHRKVIDLIATCLEELGFTVTKNNTGDYYNHVVFNDYGEDICMQYYNNSTSSGNISFLYPRHIMSALNIGSLFANNANCYATVRMVGQGPGETKTLLFLYGSSVPQLSSTYCIYFTEAKFLMTGEMKKAIIVQNGSNYYFNIYDENWSFLPGFDSESTVAISMDSTWNNLYYNNNYCYIHDPFTSYKLFEEQTEFPEIPVISNDGMWEFPDIIQNPYGYIGDSAGQLKYNLTSGTIYQIGNKKYLCNYASYYNYLYRVE